MKTSTSCGEPCSTSDRWIVGQRCDALRPCSRYVLLKERNMLMTVKHEARRLGFIMPAPERMWKVQGVHMYNVTQ